MARKTPMGKTPKHVTRLPHKALAPICGLFMLASCANFSRPDPYPTHWSSPQKFPEFNGCPKIDGVYLNRGELTLRAWNRDCAFIVGGDGECHSLAYNLLHPPHLSGKFGRRIDKPGIAQVQLHQPSPDLLEITTWPDGERHTLSAADGAFSCDASGLRLRDGNSFFTVLFLGRFTREARTFNSSADGYLIMKAELRTIGHHTVFPWEMNDDGWARWQRVEPSRTDR